MDCDCDYLQMDFKSVIKARKKIYSMFRLTTIVKKVLN